MRGLLITAVLLAPTALVAQAQEAALGKASSAYHSLFVEYSDAQLEYRQAGAGLSREERAKLENPVVAFLPRFQEEAKKYADTEDAVQFLTWVVMNAGVDNKAVSAALETMVSDHMESPGWANLAPRLASMARAIGEERVAEVTAMLLAENEQPEVQSQILFTRASVVFRNLSRGRVEVSEEQKQAAMADMTRVLELTSDERLRSRAKGTVFEATYLQVGMVAPDIVGPDIDGVEFKLSDYRGKVVMLDFWGDW